ncbi:serine/threonine protein kinase [Actinomyces viscosus]|uniref:non-specific serine/threonine protein kinase n=1 Tax=Actinomyces viscosus TaxID=1656 RepID=A0A448PHN1_ACTVI|nr:serine/threonine-protein kinase [Actinomyces viscosus]TFH52043.1 serine/threonine protein kinase [Actinomyces viscosus]VEI14416.1 Serine/threonine-protein kinase pknB [Actinomyces viscosus]
MSQSPAPRHLGSSYIMEARIGAGAQGEVWRGRRTDAREVLAFKVLRADLVENPDVVERFIKERSTLLRVRSPYVVAIRDVVIEGSTFAIVMDYVNGGDLRDLLRARGSLPPAQVASLGTRIAQGLTTVHQAGVIHRDIKPANVLLSSRPSRGGDPAETVATGVAPGGSVPEAVVPRLADFGVARICDTFSASHLTGAIGTPLYMAPEILSMQAPTSAADIYSLGIMLYEMSCGTTPFVGQPAQLLSQHARRDAGRPYGVPDALWELIALMMSKQPGMRPSIEFVAQRLDVMQSALAGLPAAPRLASPPQSTASVVPYDWDAPSTGLTADATTAQTVQTVQAGSAPHPGTVPMGPVAPTLVAGQHAHAPGQVAAASGFQGDFQRGFQGGAGATAPTMVTTTGAHAVNPAIPAGPANGAPPAPFSSQVGPQGVGYPSSEAAAGAPKRWWRRRWVAAAAVVTVLAVVGASATWWYFFSGPNVGNTWPAALPEGERVQEDQRYTDVDDPYLSEDRGMLVYSDMGKVHLFDLTREGTSKVWSGECDEARFWAGTSLLCIKLTGGASLVSDSGKTSKAPFPEGSTFLGATTDVAVVSSGKGTATEGPLIAYDATGKEKWRVGGHYEKGRVRNGFVLAYESKSKQVQVLSAKDGAVLMSETGKEPDFAGDTRFPGGVNIETGPEAFSRMTSSGATIYKADGSEAGTVSGSFSEKHQWAASVPLDSSALKEAYESLAKASSSTIPVIGPQGTVNVSIDVKACTAKVGDTKLSLPEPVKGEECNIRPIGGLRDGEFLMQVGKLGYLADETGALVVAVSPESGKVGWKAQGAYVATVSPLDGDSGARLMLGQGTTYSYDLVVSSITSR